MKCINLGDSRFLSTIVVHVHLCKYNILNIHICDATCGKVRSCDTRYVSQENIPDIATFNGKTASL